MESDGIRNGSKMNERRTSTTSATGKKAAGVVDGARLADDAQILARRLCCGSAPPREDQGIHPPHETGQQGDPEQHRAEIQALGDQQPQDRGADQNRQRVIGHRDHRGIVRLLGGRGDLAAGPQKPVVEDAQQAHGKREPREEYNDGHQHLHELEPWFMG